MTQLFDRPIELPPAAHHLNGLRRTVKVAAQGAPVLVSQAVIGEVIANIGQQPWRSLRRGAKLDGRDHTQRLEVGKVSERWVINRVTVLP